MFRSNSKGSIKKIIQWFHLWLGLTSGLVFFVMAVTGAIYAFQPELSKLTQPYLSVKEESRPYLPVSQLKEIAAKQLPGKEPTRIIYYAANRAATVHFIKRGNQPYYWAVFLNPYNGQVLTTRDMDTEFFRFILRGHMYLWLPQQIGKVVVSACTTIFAIITITGLILWWPSNKNARKSSFRVKWQASPKRLNYDLHKVLGFYASWVLVFIIVTGLAWSFESVMKAEYWLLSGGKDRPAPPKFISKKDSGATASLPLDNIVNTATQKYPGIAHYQIRLPDSDSAAVQIIMYLEEGKYAPADNLYYNQYTAKPFYANNWGEYANANAGEKANRMTYDIHTGGIAGLPGRILIFFTAIIAASLPITGFYIWWGKKKKRKPAGKGKRASVQQQVKA